MAQTTMLLMLEEDLRGVPSTAFPTAPNKDMSMHASRRFKRLKHRVKEACLGPTFTVRPVCLDRTGQSKEVAATTCCLRAFHAA